MVRNTGPRLRVPRYLAATFLLLLAVGAIAMILTASTSYSTGMVLEPGSDARCATPPAYPCASVSIDGTGTVATLGISFPASNVSSPQPAAYYTDLVEVHNFGTAPHTIASLNVTDVTGAAHLGRITVYYCTAMTGDPATSPNCAGFSIVGASGGYLSGNGVLPSTLSPGEASYIEVVAFASSSSSPSDVVTFALEMSASFPSTTTQQGGGGAPPASSSTASTSSTSSTSGALSAASTATVTLTTTRTATTTSTTVSTSVVTSISTAFSTTTEPATTSTSTQTSTATLVTTKTETTGVTTTVASTSSPGLPFWIMLLILVLLVVLLIALLYRWLRRRGREEAQPYWRA